MNAAPDIDASASNPDVGQDAHVGMRPATPLTWLLDDECGEIQSEDGSTLFYVAGHTLNPRTLQDVTFMLHAANAYPKLVDALLEAGRQIIYLHDKFPQTGTSEQVISRIDALLLELGELG